MTLVGSALLPFIFALGVVTFIIETWCIKMNRKDLAMYAGIISFAIASMCGLYQFNTGLEAIKDFVRLAMF